MINLDERYHSYLAGQKKFRIDDTEEAVKGYGFECDGSCLLYTSPSPRDLSTSRMPSSA